MSSNTRPPSTASAANEQIKQLDDAIASMTVSNRTTTKQPTQSQSQHESFTTHWSSVNSASGRSYGGSSYPPTDSAASRFGRQPPAGGQYRSGERECGSNRFTTSSSSSAKFAPNYRPQTYAAYNSKPRYSSYQDPLTKEPYLESKLRPNDAEGYRAAGVLAFRRVIGPDDKQQVQFLFGREDDSTNSKKDGRLSFLGGKIKEELDPDSLFTAARKFVKESGALLSTVDEVVEKIKEQNHGVLWIRDAKYALYFLELTTPSELGIVELYSSAKAEASAADSELLPMLELVWLDGRAFLDVLSRSSLRYQTTRRFNESSLDYDTFTTTTGRKYEMVNFTCFMLTREPATKKLREIVASQKVDEQPNSASPRPNPNESTSSKALTQPKVASEATTATESSSSSSTSTK